MAALDVKESGYISIATKVTTSYIHNTNQIATYISLNCILIFVHYM